MAPSDTNLLESWRARRDAEAFHTLVQRYAAMVYATCQRILRNSHDAEEVAQDCFVKLAQTPARVGDYIGPWLHRVATTRSLDRRKAEIRRSAATARVPAPSFIDRPIPFDDLLTRVDEAIATLPDEERSAIVAHFLEDRTQQEVANALGVSQQAISHRVKQGIENIRTVLRRKGIPVSAAVLATALSENANAALPASLSAALAKLALAGTDSAIATHASLSLGTTTARSLAGGIVVKKAIAGVAAVVLVASIAYYATSPSSSPQQSATETHSISREDRQTKTTADNSDSTPKRTRPAQLEEALQAASGSVLEPGEIADPNLYASVSGTVVDHEGNPVADARVSVIAPGMNSSEPGFRDGAMLNRILGNGRHDAFDQSDSNGRFTLSGIRFQGSALVYVNAEGFWVDNPEVGEVEIVPGVGIDGLDFHLSPGATDYGIVLDPRGNPLPDARVFSEDAGTVHVEEDGSFFVSIRGERRFLTFYVFHDVYGRSTFGDIRREPGKIIELQMRGMATLTGTITTAQGTPAAGYTVKIDDVHVMDGPSKDEIPPQFATTDENGVYRIEGIESGTYLAQVLSSDESPVSAYETTGELLPEQTHTWDHTIEAPMRVHGVVRSETRRQPMPESSVVWAVDGKIVSETQTNERGEYNLELFETPGQHLVAPLSTRTPYDEALPELGLAYGVKVSIGSGTDLELDLNLPDTFSAAAFFVDERGVPVTQGFRVDATMHDPVTGASAPSRVLQPDASGRYASDKFQTGLRCFITAWPEDGGAYVYARTPEFTGPANNGDLEFVVQLYGKARMEGRVLDADGSVLRGGRIMCSLVLANGENYGVLPVSTNWNGYFAIEEDPHSNPSAIPATAFSMTLYCFDSNSNKAWEWKSGPLEVGPGQTLDIGEVQLAERADR